MITLFTKQLANQQIEPQEITQQETKQVSGGVTGSGCTGPNIPHFNIGVPAERPPNYITLGVHENGGNFPIF